jgi:hypothetical protein
MGKQIFDYDDKVFTEVTPDLDYLIITNGNEEYNLSITELFKVHLHLNSHDHSSFTIESEVREFARQEATIIANASVDSHENTYDHTAFVDSLEAGNIADTHIAAYFPLVITNIQDGDMLSYNATSEKWENIQSVNTSGYSGTFIDNDNNIVHVEDGLVISVEQPEVWWDYTADTGISGEYGTGWYDGSDPDSPQPGWTFEEST